MKFVSDRGYEILEVLYVGRWMAGPDIEAGAPMLPGGSLYPTLLRLEDAGLVDFRKNENKQGRGRPGREYRITELGQKTVEAMRAASAVMAGAVPVRRGR